MSLRHLLVALLAVIGMATYGQANTIIGNFEDGTLDGWNSPPTGNAPILSGPAAIGVTLGSGSLQVDALHNAGFWGPRSPNLVAAPGMKSILAQATALQYDETMISEELNGGSGAFDGFAQSNEIAVTMFSPGPTGIGPGAGNGLNLFGQISFNALIASDSKNHAAQWAGDDGTRTISWNIDLIAFNDPNTPAADFKTIEQYLNQYPDITEVTIWITAQAGQGTATVGDARFYFDQILLVPEPGTLVLLGLALPALVMVRRRKA